MPLILVSFHEVNWCALHSLKLTVEAAQWGIFNIATTMTLLLPTLVQ